MVDSQTTTVQIGATLARLVVGHAYRFTRHDGRTLVAHFWALRLDGRLTLEIGHGGWRFVAPELFSAVEPFYDDVQATPPATSPLRQMYARLAAAYMREPLVKDLGGGAPGDRYPL